MYDPIPLTEKLREHAYQGNLRGYYRFRPARWYGGIVTGDVTVCNLSCLFCWTGDDVRQNPGKIGKLNSPEEAFRKLDSIGRKSGYRQMRLSGQEPTIGREHLLGLLELVDDSRRYQFILETNGILIGHEKDYAEALSNFKSLHVRVSLKGTNEEEFSKLTNAVPSGFGLQLKGLQNLVEAGVKCHPAVMTSFSPQENVRKLKERLAAISPVLKEELEIEELILYPHVKRRLERAGLSYLKGHEPDKVPKELV